MSRKRLLDVCVCPVSDMAERVPARKDIANIHLNVPDQGFVSIAQRLKRPAKRIVLVIIIFPDKAVIGAIDRYSLRTRQATNENGDIASRCHKNAQCTKPPEVNIVGVEFAIFVGGFQLVKILPTFTSMSLTRALYPSLNA